MLKKFRTPESRSILTEFIIKTSSSFGSIATYLYVFEKTGKTVDLGYISVAMALPSLFFVFFSGKILFKFTPLLSFRISSILRGLLFFLIPIFNNNIQEIAIIITLTSFFHQIIYTSKLTYDSVLVSSGQKTKFNSKRACISGISTIIGPALASIICTFLGVEKTIVVTGIFNILGTVFLQKLPVTVSPLLATNATNDHQSLKNLWIWLKKRIDISILLVVYIVTMAILKMETPLIFPFIKEMYNAGSDIAGYLYGFSGLGGLVASLIMHRYAKPLNNWIVAALLFFDGLSLYFCTLGVSLSILFALFTLLGVIGLINMITVESQIQETTPHSLQPYLFSLCSFVSGTGGAVLTIISTYLADIYGSIIILRQCALSEIFVGFFAVALICLIRIPAQKTQ